MKRQASYIVQSISGTAHRLISAGKLRQNCQQIIRLYQQKDELMAHSQLCGCDLTPVSNAGPGRQVLYGPSGERLLVAHAVQMAELAVNHIGEKLHVAVWVLLRLGKMEGGEGG